MSNTAQDQAKKGEASILKFTDWVLSHRLLVIVLSALVFMAGMASIATNLKFDTDFRVFFGPDNPQLQTFDSMEATYSKDDPAFIVIEPKSGNVFDKQTLQAIDWVTEQAWKLPFSIRVNSLTNFQHTEADNFSLHVRDLVENIDEATAADLAKARQIAMNEPVLAGRLVSNGVLSEAGSITAVVVNFSFPKKDILEVPNTVAAVRALDAELQAKFPNIKTYLSGGTMLNNAFSEAAQNDIKTLVPLLNLVVIIVMWLLLRSWAGTLTTVLVVALSAVVALGTAAAIGIKLTPPSASTPNIIMTLAIADSIHILVSMLVAMREGKVKDDAIRESMVLNFMPVMLTSVTTTIGFLCMNFSDSPPLQDLGNISAIGVMAAFVFSVTFLPAMMSLLPVKVRGERKAPLAGLMSATAEMVINKTKLVLVLSLVAAGGMIYLAQYNVADDRFAEYFDERIKFRTDTDYAMDNLISVYTLNFDLDTKEEWGIAEPSYLKTLEEFERWWYEEVPETVHVDSVVSVMKRINKSMEGDDPSFYKIPDERPIAVDNLVMYEMGLPFGLDTTNQINLAKSGTKFTVSISNVGSAKNRELIEQGVNWLKENAPHLEVEPTGPAVMFSYISKRNIDAMKVGTVVALVGISLLLIFALRSWKMGVLSLIPNLLPLGMAFGIWAIINGEIIFTMAVVSSLTLGIIVDDTIHFLSKYIRARRVLGYSAEDAIRYTFNRVGTAILVTSAILVAGFGILATSAFAPNATMTQLSAIAIFMALLCDFLLLPALLLQIVKWANGKSEI